MIRGLFARLTGEPRRGQPLFDLAVAEARRPHWYAQGQVPDSVEGRFAMLATVIALLIVRLERAGADGEVAAVALTERFVEAMDTEIREMGVGDPKLGKQVRTLVGGLGARAEKWRSATAGEGDWAEATVRSVYRGDSPQADALAHSVAELKALWARIERSSIDELRQGSLG
jgi:cytochrome b pre-mRNA-processing protein 3